MGWAAEKSVWETPVKITNMFKCGVRLDTIEIFSNHHRLVWISWREDPGQLLWVEQIYLARKLIPQMHLSLILKGNKPAFQQQDEFQQIFLQQKHNPPHSLLFALYLYSVQIYSASRLGLKRVWKLADYAPSCCVQLFLNITFSFFFFGMRFYKLCTHVWSLTFVSLPGRTSDTRPL